MVWTRQLGGALLCAWSVLVTAEGIRVGARTLAWLVAAIPGASPVVHGLVAGLALVLLGGLTVLVLMIGLELIEGVFGPPRLGTRPAYPIIRVAGLLAVGTVLIAGLVAATSPSGRSVGVLHGGAPLWALAGMAIPLGAVLASLTSASADPWDGQLIETSRDPETIQGGWERTPPDDQVPSTGQGTAGDANADAGPPEQEGSAKPNTRTHAIQTDQYEFPWTLENEVSFSDVGGMDAIKRQLRDHLLLPLSRPERAAALGVTPANVLLYGPPGTGKTMLATALAGELEAIPFAELSGATIQSKWINESAERVQTLFDEASQLAEQHGGAVIFIDEIDAVLNARDDGRSHQEDQKTVAEFLSHLEAARENGVVVIGASNRKAALDQAATRACRFDRMIHVGTPDRDAREAILQVQLAEKTHAVDASDIRSIADRTEGWTGADLAALVDAAARRALAADRPEIAATDLNTLLAADAADRSDPPGDHIASSTD